MKETMGGFKQFILRGNVVDLAVGVVIGAAFGGLVESLVKDVLTPVIGAIAKVPDFSGLFFTINGSQFMYGSFINHLISFLIVSATIYFFVVTPINKLVMRTKKEEAVTPPATPEDVLLLREIRDSLRK
jgi:large conductance mechanosensitive channel